MAVAECHRAISKKAGLAEAIAKFVPVVNANMPFWITGRWLSRPFEMMNDD
jgi:hypothetical protein